MNENPKLQDKLMVRTGKSFPEAMTAKVNMHLQLFDSTGKLKHQRFIHNSSTVSGRNGCADQLLDTPTIAKPGFMAVGAGTPSATLLGSELARVALTSKTRVGAVVTLVGDFGAGVGTGAITEAGIFNIATANTVDMFFSASFSVINKQATDTLSISWTVTIS